MRNKLQWMGLLPAVALLFAAPFFATEAQAETHVVQMTTVDFEPRFVPDALAIQPGDTVEWVNTDATSLEHVTSSGAGSSDPLAGDYWQSPSLRLGESFAHTFSEAGTYEYFSVPHEFAGMFGMITVTDDSGGGDELALTAWGVLKASFSELLPRE